MWVQVSIKVGAETVSLNVRQLDAVSRENAAARIAWFSHTTRDSGEDGGALFSRPSSQLSLFGEECCRLGERDMRELPEAARRDAGQLALAEFVRVNALEDTLRRFHEGLSRAGVSSHRARH